MDSNPPIEACKLESGYVYTLVYPVWNPDERPSVNVAIVFSVWISGSTVAGTKAH